MGPVSSAFDDDGDDSDDATGLQSGQSSYTSPARSSASSSSEQRHAYPTSRSTHEFTRQPRASSAPARGYRASSHNYRNYSSGPATEAFGAHRRATSDRNLGPRPGDGSRGWRPPGGSEATARYRPGGGRSGGGGGRGTAAESSSASASSAAWRAHRALNERGDRLADLGDRTDTTRHHACQLAQTSRALLHRCKEKKWYHF